MRRIYEKLPMPIKISIDIIWGKIPFPFKYGISYCYYKELLKRSQWWDRKKLNDYQFKQVKKLCIHAYKNIPYYRALFDQYQLNPFKLETIHDIEALPFLDKDIINENFGNLSWKGMDKSRTTIRTTGGTTGKQLEFLVKKHSYEPRELPFVDAIWSRVGFQRNISIVGVLRNQILPNGVLYQYNYKTRQYIFDSFHLTDKNIDRILIKLKELKIEYLHTYPSSVMILCEYIKKNNITFSSSLKAVLATSENIYPGQKEFIEKFLNCRVFTFYGHSECACIAGWCEKTDKYHIQSEYGYLELVDENGNVIQECGKRGEIVCTGFGNYVMPFIRYRTGDYASYSLEKECSCGRHYQLLESIEGRWTQEMFIGKDGVKISMTALNMHSDIFKNVTNYQFIQNEPGICILKLVKNANYTKNDEVKIITALEEKFDKSMQIIVIYVLDIERTIRGKQRYIVQNIKEDTQNSV